MDVVKVNWVPADCLTGKPFTSEEQKQTAGHNLNHRWCRGSMILRTIGKGGFSDLLITGCGRIVELLWWLRFHLLWAGIATVAVALIVWLLIW